MRKVLMFLVLIALPVLGQEGSETPIPSHQAGVQVDIDSADLVISGSSTVANATEQLISDFVRAENLSETIWIDWYGTAVGFSDFCRVDGHKRADIVMASRPINQMELALCAIPPVERTPLEFHIANDAITIVVSGENDFLEDVTTRELAMIFGGEAQSWNEVRPGYPEAPISLHAPGVNSATLDMFVEAVFGTIGPGPVVTAPTAVLLSEDDDVLVQQILGNPYAIGFFGYSYYAEMGGDLTALTVNGINPGDEGYIFNRGLYLYTTCELVQENPLVGELLHYHFDMMNEVQWYFPVPDEVLADNFQRLAECESTS